MRFAKCLLVGIVALGLSFVAHAQNRGFDFDQAAELVLPDNYNPQRAYPLVVFLPPANASAGDLYERFRDVVPQSKYLVLLPAGAPSNADFQQDFGRFVKRFDERLQQDIAALRQRYNVNPRRIVLTGHSLGGDLSCALSARNPELFAGIIASGTRCSYSFSKAALQTFKRTGFVAAFFIGDQDQPARISGMQSAYKQLQNNGIESTFQFMPNRAHQEIPQNLFASALRQIVER